MCVNVERIVMSHAAWTSIRLDPPRQSSAASDNDSGQKDFQHVHQPDSKLRVCGMLFISSEQNWLLRAGIRSVPSGGVDRLERQLEKTAIALVVRDDSIAIRIEQLVEHAQP